MASRLDDLIRAHAERLDQLAGPIDLTDVTSAPNDTTTVALIDIEPPWNQPRAVPLADHRHGCGRRRRHRSDRHHTRHQQHEH